MPPRERRRLRRRRQCAINKAAQEREAFMLRWTLIFLVVALIAALLGFGKLAGDAPEIARNLFFIFIVLTLVGLLFSLLIGRKPPLPPAL